MAKTRDGLKLTQVVQLLETLGFESRTGTNHSRLYTLPTPDGRTRSVPLEKSTDVRKMLVPYLTRALPNYSRNELYRACKVGQLN